MTDRLQDVEALPAAAWHDLLHSCLAVPRWIAEMSAARPFASVDAALALADARARAMTADEVDAALARHPRIGEKATAAHDAAFSTREQSAMATAGDDLSAAIAAGNLAYEKKFGRVFLIRAAGRTPAGILAELNRRLANDDAEELPEVVDQLTQIAVARLAALLEGPA